MTSGQYQRATVSKAHPKGRLPDWYVARPPMGRADPFIFTAWRYMQTERVVTQGGVGPVPWSKAYEYAEAYGFSRETAFWFAKLMCELDSADRADKRAKAEEEKRKAERKAEREKRRLERASGGVTKTPRG